MLGSIIGDVVGSQFEGQNRKGGPYMKDYNFPLFTDKCRPTDDTVMTLAVADALLHPCVSFKVSLIQWARRYPNVGYGSAFKQWFLSSDPQPYDSYGNGSAMRVSPIGFAYHKGPQYGEDDVLRFAKESALPSHGHEEGIKGAQATAMAISLALRGFSKDQIKGYVEEKFSYDLSTPLEVIRPNYGWDVTCQGSVPQAIRCFLESTDFLSCIRLAVSLGGDSDTQAAIAGGIAQAFYKKIPEQMVVETFARLPANFVDLILRFHTEYGATF